MAYRIELSPRARRDFIKIYDFMDAENSEAALTWFRGLQEAVLSLSEAPARGAVTRENLQRRQILYGRKPSVYRIIYGIDEENHLVNVIHIRHGAMQPFHG